MPKFELILAGKLTNISQENKSYFNFRFIFSSIENQNFSGIAHLNCCEFKKDMIFSIFSIKDPIFFGTLKKSDFADLSLDDDDDDDKNPKKKILYPFNFYCGRNRFNFESSTPFVITPKSDQEIFFMLHENIDNLECSDYILKFKEKIENMNLTETVKFIELHSI